MVGKGWVIIMSNESEKNDSNIMENNLHCPSCGCEKLIKNNFSICLENSITIYGLENYKCNSCYMEFTSSEQKQKNNYRIIDMKKGYECLQILTKEAQELGFYE